MQYIFCWYVINIGKRTSIDEKHSGCCILSVRYLVKFTWAQSDKGELVWPVFVRRVSNAVHRQSTFLVKHHFLPWTLTNFHTNDLWLTYSLPKLFERFWLVGRKCASKRHFSKVIVSETGNPIALLLVNNIT